MEEVMKTNLNKATRIASRMRHRFVTVAHLVQPIIVAGSEIRDELDAYCDKLDAIEQQVSAYLQDEKLFPKDGTASPQLTDDVNVIIGQVTAFALASKMEVTEKVLLASIFYTQLKEKTASPILDIFQRNGFKCEKFCEDNGLSLGRTERTLEDAMAGAVDNQRGSKITNEHEARVFLGKFATNLNDAAKESKIDPLIGRKTEIEELTQTLARRAKSNAILVGEAGVGKTAIVEGLALLITRGDVPDTLQNTEIFALDLTALAAGTRYRGDYEERIRDVLLAIGFIPKGILFIDEIHNLMGAGATGQGTNDAANLLKPALAARELCVIGSTTSAEYKEHIEKDKALVRRFARINVNEPSVEDAKLILAGLAPVYGEHHKVTYTQEAIDAAVTLTSRYMHNSFLPDKAIDALDLAGARNTNLRDRRVQVIDRSEIVQVVAQMTKTPVEDITEETADKLMRLREQLAENVYGQDEALEELRSVILTSRAGLTPSNKPSGVLLFTGPTGVGKTEAAKTLADTLGVKLLRYDMSEYAEEHSLSKLIGSPPGYVGHEQGGRLVEDICNNPYSILLLDEVEKAHPKIMNTFLQVFDDAILTDPQGKKANFRNVTIIMTSNLGGSSAKREPVGFGTGTDDTAARIRDQAEKAIGQFFTPEFRNRLTGTVHFNPITTEVMLPIVDKFIRGLAKLAAEKKVTLGITDQAREWLAKDGFEPAMGARPLGRSIERQVKRPLSEMMLIGPLRDGGNVTIDVQDDKIVLKV